MKAKLCQTKGRAEWVVECWIGGDGARRMDAGMTRIYQDNPVDELRAALAGKSSNEGLLIILYERPAPAKTGDVQLALPGLELL